MSKNRSAWSVLLAVVLAMVVMAGLAVTAFAETVTDPAELEKVLDGTQAPAEGVNYDADGNGIVEWDDLAYLNGTQVDLLPDGGEDLLSLPLDPDYTLNAVFQHLIVKGDSTTALHHNSASRVELAYPEDATLDLSGYACLKFDLFCTESVDTFNVVFLCGGETELSVPVEVTDLGWQTYTVDLGTLDSDLLSDVWNINFERTGGEVYIDNLQAVEGNVTYVAGANGVTELFDKYVIAGRPYGALPTPVRPFYTFVGWYADAEFENEVTAETIVAAADSCTLYAKWEAAESGVPMSEGGKNAILSVIPGVEDTYLYSVETPSAYEHRYLNIDIQDVTAPVVSIDFKFTSVTDANGAQITPAMYFSDRQDSGVFGAYYVIVNKATGELATTLAKDVEYTAYITLKDAYHKSLKMIPMGNANNGYKYSVEVSTPVYHEDAPNMGVFMIPSSGNHAMMSWYKSAEGEWQYAYAANNELPLLAYTAGNTYAQNTAYLRRIALGAGAATTEVRFDFQYKTAKNGDETLVAFGLNNGGTVTIQNTDGTAVTGNPVEGKWYTAVVTKDGTSMGTAFDIYTLGNDIDGSDTNDVQVELFIKNLRAKKAVSAEDGSATISGALVNDDKANLTVLSNSADAKSFAVKLSNSGYKQFRFQMKLDAAPSNFAVAYSFSDSITGTYNNPVTVIMDENHNAVRAADVQAGQWYTVVIYGTNDLYSNGSYNVQYTAVVPASGTVTITSDANVQIRGLEALSGQFGYRMYGAEIGWAKVDLSAHGYSYGYDMSQTGASEWASRTEIAAQGGQYSAMTYDFYIYEAGAEVPNFTGTWKPVFTIRGTDTVVANADLQANTWYTATVDMSNWSTGTYYQYVGNFANSQFKAYMANVCFVPATKMFDNIDSTITLDNDGDSTTEGTTSYSASGMTVTLEKNGADGDFWADRIRRDDMRGTYRVSGISGVWSDRALKIKLLDTSKELVQVDVRFLVSKDAEGKHIAPTLNVYGNTSGTPESVPYIIVDKDDNPVTELVTGNWYRIFITTQGKSNFTIVPAIEGEVEFLLDNLATYNTDELNVTLDASAQIGVTLSRFGDLQYAYANTAGANTITVKPNIAASKQVRFQFVLRELGTPAMTVSGAQIVIKDASGSTVNAADLEANTWYTAVITNSDNALGSSLTLNVGDGSTKMVIKDLVAYLTTDEPAAKTQNAQFHGLNKDEMMIAGFIGPRDEYYRGYVNMPSMVRDDIFKLLVDAGINYVTDNGQDYRDNSTHASQEILRLAAKYGINYFIKATDIATVGDVTSTNSVTIGNSTYTHENYYNYIASYSAFAAKLAEMAQYDSFGGLFLRDEPSSELFDYIAQAKQHTTQYNTENGTDLNVFANLLPGVGWYRWSNGSEEHANWQAYIQDFISTANVGYAFFDMYPIQGAAGNIEDAYIEYMGHIAYTATKNGIPWMGCVQVGGQQPSYGSTKREPTENEMHWNVNSLLAFGAKGLDYYILVAPPYFGDDADMNAETVDNHSLITINGDTTAYYDYVSGINKHVKAIDHVLMTSTHKGVIFTGSQLTTYNYSDSDGVSTTLLDTTAELNSVKLNSISAAHALTGAFDYNGKTALLVVNNSLSAADTVTLNLTGTYYPEIIQDAKTTLGAASNTVTLSLPAGHSALVILHTSAVSIDSTVAFDVNYTGAASSYENKTISVGKAYGELPTPERAGYVFDGWYLYADGSGDQITADTVVATSGAHVLYAKWTLPADTNPVAVQDNAEYNPNNATLTRSIVDGKNVYTYTTRGVSIPTASAAGRRLNFNVPSGLTHVAIEFRYTEAFKADGVTPIEPSLGVYNGSSGVGSPKIYDKNGNLIASGNAYTGLTVGEWYTVIIEPGNYTSFSFWTAHNYTTDAPILTMEIRDRASTADLNLSQDKVTFETTWGAFADPAAAYVDGSWCYAMPSSGASMTAEARQFNATFANGAVTDYSFEFMISGVTGDANVSIVGPNGTMTVTNIDGSAAGTLQEGTWYKASFHKDGGYGTSQFIVGYIGGWNAGGLNFFVRNVDVKDPGKAEVSFNLNYTGAEVIAPVTVDVGTAYGTLPTPAEREGYTFGGWYTDAACSGSAVTATTTVSGTHTLYAKWILPEDTSPVTITARDANNLSVTRSVVNGENIYTMTSVGVKSPGTSSWQWTALATAPDNTHTHMAVTFKFNFAYAADGVTPIDPTMTVYRGNSINSGVNMWIYDAETGKKVDSGNLKAALELDKWYTVVIENPTGDLQTSYHLRPCFAYSGAAQFSIDIKDRAIYTSGGEKITTPGAMADAGLLWNEAEGWHWFVYNNETSINADQRYANIVVTEDGAFGLEYEVKFNSLSGEAEAYVGLMQGVNTFYDLETGALVGTSNSARLEVGKWYRVVYKTNNAANMGTTAWTFGYLGGFGAGNASVSMRNFEALYPAQSKVSFDVNYTGGEAIDAITVKQGAAYGTLPTPAVREGYTFGGWYTDAACSGTAVTAETLVTSTENHTLYAKWTLSEDTNPIAVTARDVNNLTVTRSVVNGENVYTSTSVGVASPGTSSWQWATAVTAPDNTHKYLAVKFRITSAFASDGTTPIDPTMTVWRGTSITSGVNMWIYDAETSAQVDSGNLKATLELNKWYTVVIENPTGALQSKYYLVPCYSYAGAAKFTMEISDRAVQTETVAVAARDANNLTLTRKLEDSELLYHMSTITAVSPGSSAWQWAATITPPSNDHSHVAVTFRINEAYASDGVTAVTPNMTVWRGTAAGEGVGMWIYDVETGTLVDSGNNKGALELGKWYTVVMENPAGVLQTYYRLTPCYGISGARFDMDVKAADYTDMGGYLTTASMGKALHYMDGIWQWEFLAASKTTLTGDNRGLIITLYDDGMTSVSFDFMFTDLSGALTGKFSGSSMTIYDLETNEVVSASALSEGTWYKLVYNPGTNIGTTATKFTYPGGWGSEDIGGMNLYIRNLQASAS